LLGPPVPSAEGRRNPIPLLHYTVPSCRHPALSRPSFFLLASILAPLPTARPQGRHNQVALLAGVKLGLQHVVVAGLGPVPLAYASSATPHSLVNLTGGLYFFSFSRQAGPGRSHFLFLTRSRVVGTAQPSLHPGSGRAGQDWGPPVCTERLGVRAGRGRVSSRWLGPPSRLSARPTLPAQPPLNRRPQQQLVLDNVTLVVSPNELAAVAAVAGALQGEERGGEGEGGALLGASPPGAAQGGAAAGAPRLTRTARAVLREQLQSSSLDPSGAADGWVPPGRGLLFAGLGWLGMDGRQVLLTDVPAHAAWGNATAPRDDLYLGGSMGLHQCS
jgi:hypothetical protein